MMLRGHITGRFLQLASARHGRLKLAPCRPSRIAIANRERGTLSPHGRIVSTSSAAPAHDPSDVSLLVADVVPAVKERVTETAAYLQMARLINVVPSLLLVYVGAWGASGHALSALACWPVLVAAASSAGVAVASVVVNDYFDYKAGVDGLNAPDKPLPSGAVPPDGALMFSFLIYMAVLVAACLLECTPLRVVIAASAAATLGYTPLLKRITFIKNAIVAAIIAASPIAGAFAVGAGWDGVLRVLGPCSFVFLGVLVRELLMDISDTEGDESAGVPTLPVVLGEQGALLVAGICLVAEAGIAAWVAAHSSVAAMLGGILGPAARSTLAVCVGVGPLLPLARDLIAVHRSKFDKAVISAAVDGSLKILGIGMILLTCLAA